jgi:hypothetical protein
MVVAASPRGTYWDDLVSYSVSGKHADRELRALFCCQGADVAHTRESSETCAEGHGWQSTEVSRSGETSEEVRE